MALTAASMASKIKAAVAAVTPAQGSDPAAAQAYRDAVTQAMCQGIIDEIQTNATVTTSDAQGGVNTGTIA